MQFEWDERKASSNKTKHGISFEQTIFAFDDPYALRVEDRRHSSEYETRMWHIGEADGMVLVVVFTVRGEGVNRRYRLISARKASRKEKALYGLNKRIPF